MQLENTPDDVRLIRFSNLKSTKLAELVKLWNDAQWARAHKLAPHFVMLAELECQRLIKAGVT